MTIDQKLIIFSLFLDIISYIFNLGPELPHKIQFLNKGVAFALEH